MAEHLGLSIEMFDRLSRDGRLQKVLSLDAPVVHDGSPLRDLVGSGRASVEDSMSRAELDQAISEAITGLSEKERTALSMSYLEGYTLREIEAKEELKKMITAPPAEENN